MLIFMHTDTKIVPCLYFKNVCKMFAYIDWKSVGTAVWLKPLLNLCSVSVCVCVKHGMENCRYAKCGHFRIDIL
jgi:hypothetical protein